MQFEKVESMDPSGLVSTSYHVVPESVQEVVDKLIKPVLVTPEIDEAFDFLMECMDRSRPSFKDVLINYARERREMSSSNFVEADYTFSSRDLMQAKVFTITRKTAMIHRAVIEPIVKGEMSNEERQASLKDLVEQMRPELKGCHVFGFRFDLLRLQWEIGVQHDSLPQIVFGEELQHERLIKDDNCLYGGCRAGKTLSVDAVYNIKGKLGCDSVEEPALPKQETWRDRDPLL